MNESEIKFLLELKERLAKNIVQKQQQIVSMQEEIQHLNNDIQMINSMISKGSFTTADTLIDAESFLKQHAHIEFDNLNYSRKIFSKSQELLVTLQFEKNTISIRFLKPDITKITQEKYIEQIVKPILLGLKKSEPNIKPNLTKVAFGNEEYIETIHLENVSEFESFELIADKIQNFFHNA